MTPMSNSKTGRKFLCDATVGKLCRYMRMIGFDTEMSQTHVVKRVLADALGQERTILTRNSVLASMKLARDVVLLTDDDPWKQIKAVLDKCDLTIDESAVLTRCMEDNRPLRRASKDEVKGKVWPYVYETQSEFTICPECGRIFWPATHVAAMLDKLKSVGLI